jgi:hypothetical protein
MSENAKLSQLTASKWLLIAGYAFTILGGVVGVMIGSRIRNRNWGTDAKGKKLFAYDEPSRKHGRIMVWLGMFFSISWQVLRIILRT